MVSGHTPVTIKSFCRSKDVVNLLKMNFSFFLKDFKDLRFCFENKLGSDSFPFGMFFFGDILKSSHCMTPRCEAQDKPSGSTCV